MSRSRDILTLKGVSPCFNTARSIVCVEIAATEWLGSYEAVSIPHAALCVSRCHEVAAEPSVEVRFNTARSIVCVEIMNSQILFRIDICFNTARSIVCVEIAFCHDFKEMIYSFQYRTQHCVCRDSKEIEHARIDHAVSIPHAALCVSRSPAPPPVGAST